MTVSYNGFDEKYLTVKTNEKLAVGTPVCVNESGDFIACSASNDVFGIVKESNDYCATVQVSGYAKIKYASGTPSCGYGYLSGDGSGGITVADSGKKPVYIIGKDTEKSEIAVIL